MATKAETTQTTITNATPIKATTTETAIVLSDEFLEKVAGGKFQTAPKPGQQFIMFGPNNYPEGTQGADDKQGRNEGNDFSGQDAAGT